jgi:hypothetical protein
MVVTFTQRNRIRRLLGVLCESVTKAIFDKCFVMRYFLRILNSTYKIRVLRTKH